MIDDLDGIPDTFCIYKKPKTSGVEANLTNCTWCFIGLVYIANLRYPEIYIYIYINSLLMNVDIPIDTKRLVRISLYPSKIDLV